MFRKPVPAMGLLANTAMEPFILFFHSVLISLWFPVVRPDIKPDIKQTQFLSPWDLMRCGKCCASRWVCVLMLPFPRRAASSIHVCLYVVQHVSQRVLNDSSPAHVTHLTGKTHTHRLKNKPQDICESESSLQQLTGWCFRSLGGCLKCGPKLTDT